LHLSATAVVAIFGEEYLHGSNESDTQMLLAINKVRDFFDMLGSVDYMHWRYKNCTASWHGQFIVHVHDPTIILEVVVDQELCIC
jgi:hypothetical protein